VRSKREVKAELMTTAKAAVLAAQNLAANEKHLAVTVHPVVFAGEKAVPARAALRALAMKLATVVKPTTTTAASMGAAALAMLMEAG